MGRRERPDSLAYQAQRVKQDCQEFPDPREKPVIPDCQDPLVYKASPACPVFLDKRARPVCQASAYPDCPARRASPEFLESPEDKGHLVNVGQMEHQDSRE